MLRKTRLAEREFACIGAVDGSGRLKQSVCVCACVEGGGACVRACVRACVCARSRRSGVSGRSARLKEVNKQTIERCKRINTYLFFTEV